jgi:hypothetical protein
VADRLRGHRVWWISDVCYWRGVLRERYIVTIVGVSMIRRLRVVIFKDHHRM